MKRMNIDGDGNETAGRDLIKNITVDQTRRLPSVLASIITPLAEAALKASDNGKFSPPKYNAFEIDAKIEHNNVRRYKALVEEYGKYGTVVDAIYDAQNSALPFSRARILQYLRHLYLKTVAEIDAPPDASRMETIRAHADEIIERVQIAIIGIVRDANNSAPFAEDIEWVTAAIVCHAFFECKILEPPPDVN